MFDYETRSRFNEAYWLHKAPAVRALRDMSLNTPDRAAEGVRLAHLGYLIDRLIDVEGAEPYATMRAREELGMTWVPSLLMMGVTLVGPGANYDPSWAPAGSIKATSEVKEYPPYDPPAPPPSVEQPKVPVWRHNTGNLWFAAIGDNSPDGTPYKDDRGSFLKHVIPSPFGGWQYWEKVG
jgi:hypothetical protein